MDCWIVGFVAPRRYEQPGLDLGILPNSRIVNRPDTPILGFESGAYSNAPCLSKRAVLPLNEARSPHV